MTPRTNSSIGNTSKTGPDEARRDGATSVDSPTGGCSARPSVGLAFDRRPVSPSDRQRRRIMSRLSGWANGPERVSWPLIARNAGFVLDRREREKHVEWQVSTAAGDTIGFVHEFPDHVYAFTFTGWPVRWWNRRRAR